MVNELRGGFFRNRNDSVPISYFTNAEFGIQNPFADQVPDLTQITIDGDDVGGELRFGTLGDGTRIFDRQTTWTIGNTLSLVRGRHSLRVGGEMRRHFLDGDLQETRNRRHNFDTWFDFLTVGYRNPGDRNRARQISDTGLNVGSTVRNYRMTDWSWFIADDWRLSPNLTLNLGVRHDYYGFPSEKNGFLALYDFPAALATGNVQDGFVFASNFDPTSVPGAAGLDLKISEPHEHRPARLQQHHAARQLRVAAARGTGTSSSAAATGCSTSGSRVRSRTRCGRGRRSSASCSSTTPATGTRSRTTCRRSRCRR